MRERLSSFYARAVGFGSLTNTILDKNQMVSFFIVAVVFVDRLFYMFKYWSHPANVLPQFFSLHSIQDRNCVLVSHIQYNIIKCWRSERCIKIKYYECGMYGEKWRVPQFGLFPVHLFVFVCVLCFFFQFFDWCHLIQHTRSCGHRHKHKNGIHIYVNTKRKLVFLVYLCFHFWLLIFLLPLCQDLWIAPPTRFMTHFGEAWLFCSSFINWFSFSFSFLFFLFSFAAFSWIFQYKTTPPSDFITRYSGLFNIIAKWIQ